MYFDKLIYRKLKLKHFFKKNSPLPSQLYYGVVAIVAVGSRNLSQGKGRTHFGCGFQILNSNHKLKKTNFGGELTDFFRFNFEF